MSVIDLQKYREHNKPFPILEKKKIEKAIGRDVTETLLKKIPDKINPLTHTILYDKGTNRVYIRNAESRFENVTIMFANPRLSFNGKLFGFLGSVFQQHKNQNIAYYIVPSQLYVWKYLELSQFIKENTGYVIGEFPKGITSDSVKVLLTDPYENILIEEMEEELAPLHKIDKKSTTLQLDNTMQLLGKPVFLYTSGLPYNQIICVGEKAATKDPETGKYIPSINPDPDYLKDTKDILRVQLMRFHTSKTEKHPLKKDEYQSNQEDSVSKNQPDEGFEI